MCAYGYRNWSSNGIQNSNQADRCHLVIMQIAHYWHNVKHKAQYGYILL